MHYAYCPCDCAIASLNELRGYDYKLNANQRIMNDEITSGADILGALLMGHAYNSWWIGSDLSIEESRRLVPHQNATTMQVAISVVAASMWMIENPERGRLRAGRPAARLRPRTFPSPIWASSSRRRRTGPPCRAATNAFKGYNSPSSTGRIRGSSRTSWSATATAGPAHDHAERAFKNSRRHGTPLFVIDHDELRKNYRQFRRYLPRVQVYYAVKANPDPAIVRTLYKEGASFDVASMPEFMIVHENIKHLPAKERQDWIWDKIIYANPTKPTETLEELNQYKPLVTFDNLEEIRKIKKHAPNAGPGAAAQGSRTPARWSNSPRSSARRRARPST